MLCSARRTKSTGTCRAEYSDDAHRIQEALGGKLVDWLEKVSAEQYQAGANVE
jgi:hypothetical protein